MEEQSEFLLRLASQEARQAIACENPNAAEAHEELSRRYSAKAVASLHEEDGSAHAKADPSRV